MEDKSDLRNIPGVGKSIKKDLEEIGINQVSELKDKDPESLYDQMCVKQGFQIDRCMLYVLRCAVYFAETPDPDPKKLKWWNWSDQKLKGMI